MALVLSQKHPMFLEVLSALRGAKWKCTELTASHLSGLSSRCALLWVSGFSRVLGELLQEWLASLRFISYQKINVDFFWQWKLRCRGNSKFFSCSHGTGEGLEQLRSSLLWGFSLFLFRAVWLCWISAQCALPLSRGRRCSRYKPRSSPEIASSPPSCWGKPEYKVSCRDTLFKEKVINQIVIISYSAKTILENLHWVSEAREDWIGSCKGVDLPCPVKELHRSSKITFRLPKYYFPFERVYDLSSFNNFKMDQTVYVGSVFLHS